MKILILPALFSFMLISCGNNKTSSLVQEPGSTIIASSTSGVATPDSTINKAITGYMKPGMEHKMISSWNGTWMGEISFQSAPDQQLVKGNSIATNKMILGGRYQSSALKGQVGKNAFEAVSTLGFDNQKKLFVSTWIDNQGTGIVLMQGPWNETTKTINLTGTKTDPETGNEKNIHETIRIIDNDRQVLEIFSPAKDGKEFKTMQVLYTRKSH